MASLTLDQMTEVLTKALTAARLIDASDDVIAHCHGSWLPKVRHARSVTRR
jgi:hypothetical protein